MLKRRHPTCPLDKEEISQEGIFPDNACRREILNLEVSCNFMNGGCSWIGHLKSLDVSLSGWVGVGGAESTGCKGCVVYCKEGVDLRLDNAKC